MLSAHRRHAQGEPQGFHLDRSADRDQDARSNAAVCHGLCREWSADKCYNDVTAGAGSETKRALLPIYHGLINDRRFAKTSSGQTGLSFSKETTLETRSVFVFRRRPSFSTPPRRRCSCCRSLPTDRQRSSRRRRTSLPGHILPSTSGSSFRRRLRCSGSGSPRLRIRAIVT
jgi:hypothetical protein